MGPTSVRGCRIRSTTASPCRRADGGGVRTARRVVGFGDVHQLPTARGQAPRSLKRSTRNRSTEALRSSAMPAFRAAMASCSSTASTPSRSGRRTPRRPSFETMTPHSPGSSELDFWTSHLFRHGLTGKISITVVIHSLYDGFINPIFPIDIMRMTCIMFVVTNK